VRLVGSVLCIRDRIRKTAASVGNRAPPHGGGANRGGFSSASDDDGGGSQSAMREQLRKTAASVGNRAPPHGGGGSGSGFAMFAPPIPNRFARAERGPAPAASCVQEEMAEQRFSVPTDPTKTAATQRTSQRAERAIKQSAMREQLRNSASHWFP
jgi:hypothetical protein